MSIAELGNWTVKKGGKVVCEGDYSKCDHYMTWNANRYGCKMVKAD